MHIGMILEATFPPDIRVENECRALVEAGHTVHIFALSLHKDQVSEEFAENIFVQRLRLPEWFFKKIRVTVLRLPFYNFLWLKFLQRCTADLRLGAVHVHDIPMASVGMALARQRGIPLVLDLHENYPAALKIWAHSRKMFGGYFLEIKAWVDYERELVRQADSVIVVVEEAMERFLQAGIRRDKLHVVSNTLNLESFSHNSSAAKSKARRSSFDIIYVGGFGPHRGLKVAIEGMPGIVAQIPHARLVLVGDGSDRNELEELVERLNLSEYVEFRGWVPFEALPGLIQESDIGIVPHLSSEHTETTVPHKLFQYMYLKKPVVVSDCRPLQRIVDDAESGLVCRAGDSSDFAAAVVRLKDEKVRQRLGERGQRAVLSRYNWSVDAQELLKLYDGLTS